MLWLFIIQRVLYAIPVLLAVSLIMFGIFQLMPGTFCDEGLSSQRQRICKHLRERFGLDQPALTQYVKWVENIATRGDFGTSFAPPFPPAVDAVIGEGRLVNSLLIAGLTLFLALLIAAPTALFSVIKPNSFGDRAFSMMCVLGLSVPNFLIGLLIVEVLVGWIQVGNRWGLPIGGLPNLASAISSWSGFMAYLWHLWPVVLIAGSWQTAEVFRQLRGALLDVCGDPYWRSSFASARSAAQRWKLYGHAVGSALGSLASWFGLWFPLMFEGTMIAAVVLNVPVMELAIWNAVRSENVYVALTGLMILSTLLIVTNLIVDIFLAMGSNTRIRYEL